MTVLAAGTAANAQAASPAAIFSVDYSLDAVGVVDGGLARRGDYADMLFAAVDVDLEQAFGWRGGSAHLEALSTSGGAPGEDVGALQGVTNAEVSARRTRIYQAYVEQALAADRVNLRLGFSDLSGEFAAVDSAGVLLNPSFGMAPEFAATGAAAYPSTALGARLRVNPSLNTYAQVAAANARAGVPGDDGGADLSFDDGAFLIAEAGWTGRGKLAAGYWRLTRRQDDLVAFDAAGDPARRVAQGGYLLVDQPLTPGGAAHGLSAFLRAGVSEGRTTPFRASWQAGVLAQPLFPSRPDSSLSVAVAQARTSAALREAAVGAGAPLGREETVFELAYSDQVTPWLRVQPDVQYVRRPGADRAVDDALVLALRFNVGFTSPRP